MKKDELVIWLKLTLVRGIGPSRLLRLFSFFGTIDDVYRASPNELLKTRVFNEKMVENWESLKSSPNDNYTEMMRQCDEAGITITTLIDETYPKELKTIPSPPTTLFLWGDSGLLYSKKIAIVGSRQSDQTAKDWARESASYLVDKGYTLVSGGALGADTIAHRTALDKGGKTICVLGSGFFRFYPEENTALFNEIKERGLLVSEHSPNFPGSKIALASRNRITSGISEAIINVACSAGETSGALVQSKIAYAQRIPLFCPSSYLNCLPNEGMRKVITDFRGIEVRNAEDVLNHLEMGREKKPEQQPLSSFA